MARNTDENEEPGGGERVAPLAELPNVEVADGKPDIRGWEVVGHDRRTIGQVHDLIVDMESMKVRYVDVEMRREAIEAERDRHVLVPIGYARLEEDDDRVLVNNIVTLAAGALPAYDHGPLTRAEEMSLHRTYEAASPAAGAMPENDSNYYGHERFDDSRFWGRRKRAAEYLRRLR